MKSLIKQNQNLEKIIYGELNGKTQEQVDTEIKEYQDRINRSREKAKRDAFYSGYCQPYWKNNYHL